LFNLLVLAKLISEGQRGHVIQLFAIPVMAPISFSAAFARAREAITTFTSSPKRDSSSKEIASSTQHAEQFTHIFPNNPTLTAPSVVAMPPGKPLVISKSRST
jgi:hypothetical protein